MLLNLEFAIKCDAYIGTLASNWCRLVDELRATVGKIFLPYDGSLSWRNYFSRIMQFLIFKYLGGFTSHYAVRNYANGRPSTPTDQYCVVRRCINAVFCCTFVWMILRIRLPSCRSASNPCDIFTYSQAAEPIVQSWILVWKRVAKICALMEG